MILASHGIVASQIASFDADAVAFFGRVTTAGGSLSATEKAAVNQLVLDLKANSLWTPMKAIYPMVGASAAACAQNLKSSSFTGTFTSGWTFASTGVTPNGTSAYMDTGFNPSINNSANSSHLSYYSRTLVNQSKVDIGCYSGTNYNQIAISFGGTTYCNPNNASADIDVTFTSNSQGFFLASRTGSTNIMGQRNSTQTTGSAPTNRNNLNIFIGAVNLLNSGSDYSTKECAFSSIGDGLTDTQASNLYTAVQAMQTTLSRQV